MTVCISATFFLKVSLSSASMGGLIASLLAGELQLPLSRSGRARLSFDGRHRGLDAERLEDPQCGSSAALDNRFLGCVGRRQHLVVNRPRQLET
jgi:hypothetical protein